MVYARLLPWQCHFDPDDVCFTLCAQLGLVQHSTMVSLKCISDLQCRCEQRLRFTHFEWLLQQRPMGNLRCGSGPTSRQESRCNICSVQVGLSYMLTFFYILMSLLSRSQWICFRLDVVNEHQEACPLLRSTHTNPLDSRGLMRDCKRQSLREGP